MIAFYESEKLKVKNLIANVVLATRIHKTYGSNS